MNKPFFHNEPHLPVTWRDLEAAWRKLAAPGKQAQVADTLSAVRALSLGEEPEMAVFTMIAATAWLTDDGPVSKDDWQP